MADDSKLDELEDDAPQAPEADEDSAAEPIPAEAPAAPDPEAGLPEPLTTAQANAAPPDSISANSLISPQVAGTLGQQPMTVKMPGAHSDVSDYITKRLAEDKAGLGDAQAKALKNQQMANLIEGLGQIDAGVARSNTFNPAAYSYLHEQANNPVAAYIAQKKNRQEGLEAISQEDQLAQQRDAMDPGSDEAKAARAVYAPALKRLGIDPTVLDNMGSSQIKNFVQQPLEYQAKLAQAKATADQAYETKQERIDEQKRNDDLRDQDVRARIQAQQDQRTAQMEAQKEKADAAAAAMKEKTDAAREKLDNARFTAFGDAIDSNKGRSGEFGRQQQFANNADRVLALSKQFPDGNIPSAQMGELASASASLIGGGGAAESTVNRYVPHTLAGSAAGIQEWLTNNPTGTGQKEFAKLMFDSAQREKDLAQSKIKAVQFSRIPQFEDLRKRDPDKFNSIMQAKDLDPDEYDAFKKNGYKAPAASSRPAMATVPSADPALEAEMRKRGLLQ